MFFSVSLHGGNRREANCYAGPLCRHVCIWECIYTRYFLPHIPGQCQHIVIRASLPWFHLIPAHLKIKTEMSAVKIWFLVLLVSLKTAAFWAERASVIMGKCTLKSVLAIYFVLYSMCEACRRCSVHFESSCFQCRERWKRLTFTYSMWFSFTLMRDTYCLFIYSRSSCYFRETEWCSETLLFSKGSFH